MEENVEKEPKYQFKCIVPGRVKKVWKQERKNLQRHVNKMSMEALIAIDRMVCEELTRIAYSIPGGNHSVVIADYVRRK